MTSYDDRPNNDPWASPAWSPPSGPPVWAPARTPGLETRQVLLVLGAGCLIAALAAGTAVVWHALGPTGQAAVMVAVTALVLALAVRLERLPATAQALGAVGVAGLLIDCVAGRSLELSGVRDLPLHVYAGLTASTVTILLAGLSVAVRRLWAPPVGCAIAAMSAVVAWVQPTTIERAAWLGFGAVVIAVLVERVLVTSGPAALVGRFVNATLAVPLVVVGAMASVAAAGQHGQGGWAGVALVVLLLALPETSGVRASDVETAASLAGGVLAAALLVASTRQALGDVKVAIAGAAAAVGVGISAIRMRGLALRLKRAAQTASLTVVVATYSLVSVDASSFARLNMTYAVVCVAVAVAWRGTAGDALMVRGLAAVAAVPFATVGVDLQLHLDRVAPPEAYVLTPALGLLALGAGAMLVWRTTPSWALVPGIVLGLLPTVSLALGGDRSRQAIALAAGAVLVIVGAQLRLVGPLAMGGYVLSVMVLRVAGPQVKRLPEWVTLGVVGIVLLTLGATWEARMLDLRRAAHAIRPRIAALR